MAGLTALQMMMGASAAGTVISVLGQGEAGRKAHERGLIQKAVSEVAAGQAIAVGQRSALEAKRQADLMASRALAIGAAGGAQDDIDILMADIEGDGEYRAGLAMYEAETRAEEIKFKGELAAQAGKDQQSASGYDQFSTILSGASSLAGMKYASLAKTTKS